MHFPIAKVIEVAPGIALGIWLVLIGAGKLRAPRNNQLLSRYGLWIGLLLLLLSASIIASL